MQYRIPLCKPALPAADVVQIDYQKTLRSGQITNGENVRQLEENVKELTGAAYAVAVSSATLGLALTMKAMVERNRQYCEANGITDDGEWWNDETISDKVAVSPFTFAATVTALHWAGLHPRFVDCNPDGSMNAEELDKIKNSVSYVMPTDIFGQPVNIESIYEIINGDLPVIVDSAQSLGARYQNRRWGCQAFAHVFSMSPTKVLTAGEGGVVTTNFDWLADALRLLRDYGWNRKHKDVETPGLNARMSEFNAIIGKHNTEKGRAKALLDSRKVKAATYDDLLKTLVEKEQIVIMPTHQDKERVSSCNYYVIRVIKDNHAHLVSLRMKGAGIETKQYFSPLANELRFYSEGRRCFEMAEKLSTSCLALPLYNDLTTDQQYEVVETLTSTL